jgi:hypothetical protein
MSMGDVLGGRVSTLVWLRTFLDDSPGGSPAPVRPRPILQYHGDWRAVAHVRCAWIVPRPVPIHPKRPKHLQHGLLGNPEASWGRLGEMGGESPSASTSHPRVRGSEAYCLSSIFIPTSLLRAQQPNARHHGLSCYPDIAAVAETFAPTGVKRYSQQDLCTLCDEGISLWRPTPHRR